MSKPVKTYQTDSNFDLVILGNGPSLKEFLEKHTEFLHGKKKMAVNHFANTEAYVQVKPDLYILNAPEFWLTDVNDDYIEKRKLLFQNLADKTHWKMDIFMGAAAKKATYWQEIIKKNEQIRVHYYNLTPIAGFQQFRHFCYSKYLGLPRPHNVLIPSLIIAINSGFKNIYVSGADHDWMKEIFVADDNTVYLTQKHFYDAQTAKPEIMKKLGKDKRKMHEILIKFVHAFKGYFDINTYAKEKKSKIINITPGSFIDAFDRRSIK